MNAHRMDQETAERLLGGPVGDPWDGPRSLVLLLTAVRAAPHAGELAGEAAAVRAYQLARAGTPLGQPGRPRRGFTLAGFGARAALASLALAATGGVALAAAGGALPNPLAPSAPTTPPASSAPTTPAATPGGTGQRSTPSAGVDGHLDAPASVVGLCRTYRAAASVDPGRSLDNPVFGDLISAAGGRDEVSDYCDRVLADGSGPTPAGGTPTQRPDTEPSARPTGRQTQPAPAQT
ncbi:hypothetical protein, partial [Micromonospora deserti]